MSINFISFDENGDAQERIIEMPKLPEWGMARRIGYEPQTTFWDDFSIADLYGPEAIVDTFRRAFREWKHDVKYIAEMSLVLNHKGMWWYEASQDRDNDPVLMQIAMLYFRMWEQLHEWAKANYTGENAEYYFRVTD